MGLLKSAIDRVKAPRGALNGLPLDRAVNVVGADGWVVEVEGDSIGRAGVPDTVPSDCVLDARPLWGQGVGRVQSGCAQKGDVWRRTMQVLLQLSPEHPHAAVRRRVVMDRAVLSGTPTHQHQVELVVVDCSVARRPDKVPGVPMIVVMGKGFPTGDQLGASYDFDELLDE